MANHGALTVGDSLYRAWERMETLEQLARVTLVTRLLGADRLLPGADGGRACVEARAEAGYPPPACAPGDGARGALPPAYAPAADGAVTLTRRELVRLIDGGGGALRRRPRAMTRALDSGSPRGSECPGS